MPWPAWALAPRAASASRSTSTPPRPVSAKSSTRLACSGVKPAAASSGLLLEFFLHALPADLRQLVERPEDRPAPSRKAQRVEHAVEDLAIVERDREVRHSGGGQGGVDHLGDLGVGQHALGADDVEIALDELAEPALGGPLAPEDRADGIPLEGQPQLVHMPGDEPGQGDGEVEPEGKLARRAPLVGHLEDLPQDLVRPGPLAGQDLHALDVRRLDRHETEARKRLAERRQHPLAGDHHRGRQVPQPAGHAGVDHVRRILNDKPT